MKTVLYVLTRAMVFGLLLIGLAELWETVEIALYGISQKSIVDSIVLGFLVNRLDDVIWGRVYNGKH